MHHLRLLLQLLNLHTEQVYCLAAGGGAPSRSPHHGPSLCCVSGKPSQRTMLPGQRFSVQAVWSMTSMLRVKHRNMLTGCSWATQMTIRVLHQASCCVGAARGGRHCSQCSVSEQGRAIRVPGRVLQSAESNHSPPEGRPSMRGAILAAHNRQHPCVCLPKRAAPVCVVALPLLQSEIAHRLALPSPRHTGLSTGSSGVTSFAWSRSLLLVDSAVAYIPDRPHGTVHLWITAWLVTKHRFFDMTER